MIEVVLSLAVKEGGHKQVRYGLELGLEGFFAWQLLLLKKIYI